jgi:opacity protein-like surface antigen
MKKSLSLLAVLAVAGVASSPAPADAANRYVSGLAGISWFNDSDASSQVQSPYYPYSGSGIATFGSGFTAAAAVGCDYGSTRAELELGYQRNDLDPLRLYGEDFSPNNDGYNYEASGKTSVYSLMANGFYDIELGKGAELYAMAGVGVAQVNLDLNITENSWSAGDPAPTAIQVATFSAHETTLAYQLGAGIAVPVSKGVKLDARYRYFATTDFTLETPNPGFFPYTLNTNVSSHSVLLGLRIDI